MQCPACDHDNIPGADLCESCGLDLAGLDVVAWGVDPRDALLTRPLGELPLKPPVVVDPDATVAEAVQAMRERGEGCVFAGAGDRPPVGVLTERDVLSRIVAPGRDPGATLVREVMTGNPVVLERDDPLAWALHRMGVDGHRHLPVLDGGRLVGLLSIRTVLRVLRP